MCHRPDNRLPAGMDVNVLDAHRLLAAASELGERLGLHCVCTQELHSEIPTVIGGRDVFRVTRLRQHVQSCAMRRAHLDGEHGFGLIPWTQPVHRRQGRIDFLLGNRSRPPWADGAEDLHMLAFAKKAQLASRT